MNLWFIALCVTKTYFRTHPNRIAARSDPLVIWLTVRPYTFPLLSPIRFVHSSTVSSPQLPQSYSLCHVILSALDWNSGSLRDFSQRPTTTTTDGPNVFTCAPRECLCICVGEPRVNGADGVLTAGHCVLPIPQFIHNKNKINEIWASTALLPYTARTTISHRVFVRKTFFSVSCHYCCALPPRQRSSDGALTAPNRTPSIFYANALHAIDFIIFGARYSRVVYTRKASLYIVVVLIPSSSSSSSSDPVN